MYQLNPLRFYWDHKFRKSINEQYFKEGKITKEKDLKALKKALSDRLDYLKTVKKSGIGDIKEAFRKNFTKSLDHKSFQYKDFMKKFTQKQYHEKMIKKFSEARKRLRENELSLLYGVGEVPEKSDLEFYNTFCEDFGKLFDKTWLNELKKRPNHPIDMQFIQNLPL